MHRKFQELLPDAEGSSHWVIVVFLDVRGFSTFAGSAESVQAALFLKKMYLRILDDYFPGSDFLKPTGDGLMVIFRHGEDDLAEKAQMVVNAAERLVDDFPTFMDHEPMVNFSVPTMLGIGITRGAATRLATGDVCLDYSGRPLNLAARLMDLARPRGLVLDSSFNSHILGDDKKPFDVERVYVKGIAEVEPLSILYRSEWSTVPDSARRPIGTYTWVKESVFEGTFSRLCKAFDTGFQHKLSHAPAFPDDIRVEFVRDATTAAGAKIPGVESTAERGADYVTKPEGSIARLAPATDIIEIWTAAGVKPTWPVQVNVSYQALPEV